MKKELLILTIFLFLFSLSFVFSVKVIIPDSDGTASTLSMLDEAKFQTAIRYASLEAARTNPEFDKFLKISGIDPSRPLSKSASERLFDLVKEFYTVPKLNNEIVVSHDPNARVNTLEIRKKAGLSKARVKNSGGLKSGAAVSKATSQVKIEIDISGVSDISGSKDSVVQVVKEMSKVQLKTVEALRSVAQKAIASNTDVSKTAMGSNERVSTTAIKSNERIARDGIDLAREVIKQTPKVSPDAPDVVVEPQKVKFTPIPRERALVLRENTLPQTTPKVNPVTPVEDFDIKLLGPVVQKDKFFSLKISPKFAKIGKGLIIAQLMIEGFNYLHINYADNNPRSGPKVSLTKSDSVDVSPVYLVSINSASEIGLPNDEFFIETRANQNIFAKKLFLEERLTGAFEGFKNLSVYNAYQENISTVGPDNELVSSLMYLVISDNKLSLSGECIVEQSSLKIDCSKLVSDIKEKSIQPDKVIFLIDVNPMIIGAVMDSVESDLTVNNCSYINPLNENNCELYLSLLADEDIQKQIDFAKEELFDKKGDYQLLSESFIDGFKSTFVTQWVDVSKDWVETKNDWDTGNATVKTLSTLRSSLSTIGAAANSVLYVFGGFALSPIVSSVVKRNIESSLDNYKTYKYASRAVFVGLPVVYNLDKSIEPIKPPEISSDLNGDTITIKLENFSDEWVKYYSSVWGFEAKTMEEFVSKIYVNDEQSPQFFPLENKGNEDYPMWQGTTFAVGSSKDQIGNNKIWLEGNKIKIFIEKGLEGVCEIDGKCYSQNLFLYFLGAEDKKDYWPWDLEVKLPANK